MKNAKLNKAIKSTKAFSESKTVKCPNQHCDEGVVEITFDEKQFCGICDGEGVVDSLIKKD